MQNRGDAARDSGWWKPYVAFGVFALLVFAVSIILKVLDVEPYGGLLLNVSAALFAVVIVELLWRMFGGEPIVQAIASLRASVRQLRELESSGITSIKIERHILTEQPQVEQWDKMLQSATKVDLMAFSLRDFVRFPQLIDGLEGAIARNLCKVRVITYEMPGADGAIQRLLQQQMDEEEVIEHGAQARMTGRLQGTWPVLLRIADRFQGDPERRDKLELKVARKLLIRATIIRIDNQIWVSPYLSSCLGGSSPAFQISGPDSPLFERYLNEFDHMWEHAAARV